MGVSFYNLFVFSTIFLFFSGQAIVHRSPLAINSEYCSVHFWFHVSKHVALMCSSHFVKDNCCVVYSVSLGFIRKTICEWNLAIIDDMGSKTSMYCRVWWHMSCHGGQSAVITVVTAPLTSKWQTPSQHWLCLRSGGNKMATWSNLKTWLGRGP